LDINVWIVFFLIIFMLHNLEEIITIERWFQEAYPRIEKRIPSFVQRKLKNYKDITSVQFAIVVFVFSVFVSVFILIVVITQHYYLFLGINLFFSLNMLTHPLQALYVRYYTPGVLTSILLIIPYYILFFRRVYNTDILTIHSILSAIIVMIFLVPLFLLSHKIGRKWG